MVTGEKVLVKFAFVISRIAILLQCSAVGVLKFQMCIRQHISDPAMETMCCIDVQGLNLNLIRRYPTT